MATLVGAVALLASRHPPEDRAFPSGLIPRSEPSASPESEKVLVLPPAPPTASIGTVATPPATSLSPSLSIPKPKTPPLVPPVKRTGPEDVVAEERILHRARDSLPTAPKTALDLTDAHARNFPHGVLSQEREVLAIDALGRLGRTTEASSRAIRFQATWPASPYVGELRNRGLIE